MTDDELTRRIRSANPARTPLDSGPNESALVMRDRIMGSPGRIHRHAFARTVFAAVGVIAVVAVAAVTFFMPQAPAAAVTPAVISFTGESTMREVIAIAQSRLQANVGPGEPVRFAQSESWGLSVDIDEQRSEIVPQVMTLSWEPDLSGKMTVVAGASYWPAADATQPGSDAAVRPGEVISHLRFAPGEFGTPVVNPPGTARDDLVELLNAFGMPRSPTASDVLQSTTGVFEQWTLTNEQHAQLLEILVDAGGLTILGSGTDRAGRPVLGMETKSIYPGVADLVLVSEETGRIVGVESVRVTRDGIVPAGAVISYRMWDTDVQRE